jgi:hypothetical protein
MDLVPTFFLGEGDVGTIFMRADSARMCGRDPARLRHHLVEVVLILVDRVQDRMTRCAKTRSTAPMSWPLRIPPAHPAVTRSFRQGVGMF